MRRRIGLIVLATVVLTGVSVFPVFAQDEEDLGWSDVAELGFVATSGNSDTTTLNFKNTTWRRWDKALFEIKLGGIKVETGTDIAVGTPGDFEVVSVSQTTTENYYFNANYNREITERFFWYAGLGWQRNEFAGIKNRYVVEGGVGNIWKSDEKTKWWTKYALTYTDQQNVIEVPGADTDFVGLRGIHYYERKFGKSATYVNDTTLDFDLETTSNWRGDMINSIAVTMTDMLSLKASLQWLYENDPALGEITLFDTADNQIGSVIVPLDSLDSIFTVALVVNF